MSRIAPLRQGTMTRIAGLLQLFGSVRMIGTAATLTYCAIHLAITHRISPLMAGGALVFGIVVAIMATRLAGLFTSSRSG